MQHPQHPILSQVASQDANSDEDVKKEEWMTWFQVKHSEEAPHTFAGLKWKGLGQPREESNKNGQDMQQVVSTLRKTLKDAN